MTAGNPNHPLTQLVANEWHKLCALAMFVCDAGKVTITGEDIEAFKRVYGAAGGAITITTNEAGEIELRIVTAAEGERVAREAGGLAQ